MAISSIHVDNSSASADIHNTRVFVPDYLISKADSTTLEISEIHISTLEQMAKDDYKLHSKNHRAMPSNATLIKEAVVNIKEDTTEEELLQLCKNLEEEFGYTIRNVSIHRDEGYIFTDEKNYTMGREQYKNENETPYIAEFNQKNGKFYEWKKEGNEWQNLGEIKDYTINYNRHAHIMLLNFDFTTHRTVRLQKKGMSRMQTVAAESLGMERGKCSSTVEAKKLGVEVQESRARMNIRDYKQMKQREANNLIGQTSELKITVAGLKAELEQERLSMADAKMYTKEDYKALGELKKVANKDNVQEIYLLFIKMREEHKKLEDAKKVVLKDINKIANVAIGKNITSTNDVELVVAKIQELKEAPVIKEVEKIVEV